MHCSHSLIGRVEEPQGLALTQGLASLAAAGLAAAVTSFICIAGKSK
jgi:hypothetical protein